MNFISSAVPPAHTDKAIWLIFKDNCLLIKNEHSIISFPVFTDSQAADLNLSYVNYIGIYGSEHCLTGILTSDTVPEKHHFIELRSLYDSLNNDMYTIACKAFEVLHWDKTHQFCSQCGSTMVKSGIDFSKICPNCNFQNFPRISPAIIVAIIRENKILLARHPGSEIFSVVAGYVDIGETLEEAVKREAMEEVNIELKNIRYFTSQPWVFSHALMVAYTAEYYKGELKADGKEIEEAGWFSATQMPARLPRPLSISRKLIDWFLNENSSQVNSTSSI